MNITVLSENTSSMDNLGSEHGLSVLVEMGEATILFDTGCGSLFLQNAEKLGKDLSLVTHLILSHGHYDHGGGIPAFLNINKQAQVFLRPETFSDLYVKRAEDMLDYVGLPEGLKDSPRLTYTHDGMIIAPGVTLYSDIALSEPVPGTNWGLLMKQEGELVPDSFAHEQVAELMEDGKILLLSGCSHHGIVNVLRDYQTKTGREPDMIIGGFHLHSHVTGRADDAVIDHVAQTLAQTKAEVYTCHCTGLPAYEELKKRLPGQIDYLSGGQSLTLS